MYLTEIDKKKGLLNIEDINDGILAIKEFRELIEHKDFGLECLTAVALVADYQSPIRFYSEDDRPRKAMEEVTGERDRFVWREDIIQIALKKYESLQYDPTLEEKRIHYDRKINKLKQLQDIDKPLPKDDEGNFIGNKPNPAVLAKELREINKDLDYFDKQNEGKDLFANAPVRSGYTLTRLEQLEEKKNSFYNTVR